MQNCLVGGLDQCETHAWLLVGLHIFISIDIIHHPFIVMASGIGNHGKPCDVFSLEPNDGHAVD